MNAQHLLPGHTLRLLRGGADYFPALLRAIDGSRFEVRLETYIFHFASAGIRVAEALERAASRGVAVYLVMDGIGTPVVPPQWVQRFAAAGVQWRQYSPLGRWGLLVPSRWRRMHRKLCVVDGITGFCGGINIVDDHHDPEHGELESPRFDMALQVSGPLVADMWASMLQLWGRMQVARQLERFRWKPALASWRDLSQRATVGSGSNPLQPAPGFTDVRASLVLRDNVRNRSRIERAYLRAFATARHDIYLANAYFLPGRRVRNALRHAARRGVRVHLLIQGRYDNFMQFHAARPVIAQMQAAGIAIHEYSVGLLHAKVAVVDSQWGTIGSSNLDPLSLLLAREANVIFEDAPLAGMLQQQLTLAMDTASVLLDPSRIAQRAPWHRFLDRLAFGLMRLLLFVAGRRY